ncbi:MAG TPA: phosphoglucomutase/phosphomannomutase family protein, partial [Armatimonadota bacterium]|nr:phosphoglucomutase/phosphomannomutase family protein [Armatimonadota bacterium]
MKPIRFGTDGWRGVIADDFTYHRVAVVCEAIGEYLQQEGTAERGVAIGFDNRFASEEFANLAAIMLTRRGIHVRLSEHSLPTPVISYTIKHHNLGGGIMITASHNPAKYNGVKFKPWFAGSASAEATKAIEERANNLLSVMDVDAVRNQGPDNRLLSRENLVPDYLRHVLGFIQTDEIRTRHPRLMVDPLFGSSIGVLDRALSEAGCEIDMIHGEWNPAFGGLNPEPIAENLGPLFAAVRDAGYDGAVASDGDGDRLGASTEHGDYISPHHLFALLLIHLVEDRGMRGGVVKTVSTTTMINQLAEKYGLQLYETPIGFKYIGQLMLEKDILIGGEESGGIGVKGHIPERDATLAGMLLIEMMAHRRTTLGGLLAQLRDLVGEHFYHRIDMHLKQPVTPEQYERMRRQHPAQINHVSVR